jgi:hypothetical protein
MAGLDLETTIRALHGSEIRVGIETFNGGIAVWISDRMYRVRTDRVFKASSAMATRTEDTAALWLHTAALRLFPGSTYAHEYGTHEVAATRQQQD